MFSQLVLGTTVLPNPVERFEPEAFTLVPRSAVEVMKRPDELPSDFILQESLKNQIMHTGSYSLSPFSFNWNQHSRIYTLLAAFKRWSNQVVLSSCRVDAIARDPGLAELIDYFGAPNLTCAVEGVSQRICNFLQKSLMDEELYVGMAHIIKQRFGSVKFYYIYTGLETQDDVDEFERHLGKIDELRRMAGKPAFEMRMSFTPLLSTLGTPLQYHGSKVQRSLKTGSYALYRIRHACTRYNFGIRLSTSIASSDFAQTIEFLDRRGQGLLEYASLCGIYTQPNIGMTFYDGERKVGKREFNKLPGSQRMERDGELFAITPTDRMSVNNLYAIMNHESLYPEMPFTELQRVVFEHEGRALPAAITDHIPARRRQKIAGRKVRTSRSEGDHFIHAYPFPDPATGENKRVHHMCINVKVDDVTMDRVKELIPVFTNGQTFNDLIDDKDAIHVFPSSHIKFHANRHIGQDFKQYVSNRAYVFDSYCFADALGMCVNCGACDSIQEVKSITTQPLKETGASHFHLITDVKRDAEPFTKLLVEVRIEPGRYGAMRTRWLRYAVTRAILRASDGALVEPHIAERFIHSRQGYRIKQDNFRSILSGSLLLELSFNSAADMSNGMLDQLRARVNDYATAGWRVANIVRKPGDYLLKNALEFALTTYRFDSRKVPGVGLDYLRAKIERFTSADTVLKYKAQEMSGRFATRVVQKDFDKAKVTFINAGVGRNRYETVLRTMARVEENHPLIFLAGFLGGDGGGDRPKAYGSLYGADIVLEGFYQRPQTADNVFDLMGDHQHSTACPCCGGGKFINIVTGLPFGGAEYERDDLLLAKHKSPVCQDCFAEGTA